MPFDVQIVLVQYTVAEFGERRLHLPQDDQAALAESDGGADFAALNIAALYREADGGQVSATASINLYLNLQYFFKGVTSSYIRGKF